MAEKRHSKKLEFRVKIRCHNGVAVNQIDRAEPRFKVIPPFFLVGHLHDQVLPDSHGSVLGILGEQFPASDEDDFQLKVGVGMEPLEEIEEENLRAGKETVTSDEQNCS